MSKLARLFDYQKFEANSELSDIILDVESRYGAKKQALSDDELEFVAAAGYAEDGRARQKDCQNQKERGIRKF